MRAEMCANDRVVHALLDRGAASGTARNLAIGVRREQPAVREHRLTLLVVAMNDILHDQGFAESIDGFDLRNRPFESPRHR